MYDSKLAYESVKMAGTFTRPSSRLSGSTAGVSSFLGATKDLTRLAIQTSQWIHKYVPNLKILRDRNLQVILNDPDAIFCSLYIAISKTVSLGKFIVPKI